MRFTHEFQFSLQKSKQEAQAVIKHQEALVWALWPQCLTLQPRPLCSFPHVIPTALLLSGFGLAWNQIKNVVSLVVDASSILGPKVRLPLCPVGRLLAPVSLRAAD